MAENLEIEFKSMLSPTEFQHVRNYYQLAETSFKKQINYYFDTPNQDLHKRNFGLRIRITNQGGELTLKTPDGDGLLETTDFLDKETAKDLVNKNEILLMGNVAKTLQKNNISPDQLKLIADLTTARAEFPIEIGLLAIDESWYGKNGHDYELELEVQEAKKGATDFQELLIKLQVSFKPAENKIKRAIKEFQR